MKKYLYEIDERYGINTYWHTQAEPYMPRVLAEKTAKSLNRSNQRQKAKTHTKYHDKFKANKTTIVTKDHSPKGYKDWYEFYNREED